MQAINTHGLTIDFGKHKGERFTRLPVSYLKWLVNENTQVADIAKAELERRGVSANELEISFHAIDRASTHFFHRWRLDKRDIGLYQWLYELTATALEKGKQIDDCYYYDGIKFVFDFSTVVPVLKTVIPATSKIKSQEEENETI
jgi:hypothetical protein